jgi:hypothetical protein
MKKIDITELFANLENYAYEAASRGIARAVKDNKAGVKASAGKSGGTRATGEKRSAEAMEETMEAIARYVREDGGDEGLSMEQLKELMGISDNSLTLPTKKLLAAKRLKTKGHKRATRYFPTAKT